MKKIYLILLAFLGIHLFLLTKLQFTAWPEMLSYPFLFSHGFTLYKDFVIPYPPFLVLLLSAIYGIFGYQEVVLKLFTWFIILAGDLLIFLISKRITKNNFYAFLSLAAYIMLAPFLEGNMLWLDTFLVLPVLLSVYFLLKENFFVSGVFAAVAAFSKQTALIYLLVLSLYILFGRRDFKKLLLFVAPFLVLCIVFLFYLINTGSLNDFLNWNIILPFKYWSKYPSYVQFNLGRTDLMTLTGLIIPAVLIVKKQGLIFLVFLGSLLAVYPRFSYYHLSVAVALSSICLGILASLVEKKVWFFGSLAVFVLMFFIFKAKVVLAWDWGKQDRFFGTNDLKLSQNVDSETAPGQTIYLANVHSGIYVYTSRLPPKPWFDDYGWYFEVPGQQDKAIDGWSISPPEVIYWGEEGNGNWYLPGIYRPQKIYNWMVANYYKEKEVTNGVWLWRKK